MTQLKTILLAGALLTAGAASAQQYRHNLLYEANGPVREIVLHTENPYFSPAAQFPLLSIGKAIFQENGKLKQEMMTYDAEGYPVGFGTNMGKTYTTFRVIYDEARQPVQLFFDGNTDKDGLSHPLYVETAYENGQAAARRFYVSPESEQLICVYSDIVTDDHGNWISRHVTESTVSPDSGDITGREYTETREITYF